MISIGINLLGQVAKTAVISAVSSKVVDTLISSKLNKQSDHQKWRRETKLQLFTKLSQELLSFDIKESSTKEEKSLKEICTKTLLVLDDKKLIYKIEEYMSEFNKTQRALVFDENNSNLIKDFNNKSMQLVIFLNDNLKRS